MSAAPARVWESLPAMDFAEIPGQAFRGAICFHPHQAVTHFQARYVGGKPVEVFLVTPAGKTGKYVVHTEEKLALGEVHQQRHKIASAALNLDVVPFRCAIDAQMRLRVAGHSHGNFFAEKEIGMFAEGFRAINGVVIRQGEDGHAALFAPVVNRGGLVVGLLAKPGKARGVAHARSCGVEMEVASHGSMLDAGYEQSMKSATNKHESWHGTY